MYRREQRKILILLTLFIFNVVAAWRLKQFSEILRNTEPDNEWNVWSSILRKIDSESYFDFALIIGEVQQEFILKLLELELNKRVLLNNNYEINKDLEVFFNNFIVIAFMPNYLLKSKENAELFVQVLAEKLNLRRLSRLIFIETRLVKEESEKEIENLLRMCEQYRFLNAIVLAHNFSFNRKYFSFEAFPYFEMSTNIYKESSSSNFFPDKMNNVYGAVIRTRPDQIMPRSVVYTDAEGRLKVTGYIAQFIRMYGEYINATIKYPADLVPGDVLFYRDFINWTEMDLLDIPCSITPMVAGNTNKRMSYMYEILSWCLMMPVEQSLTYRDFLESLVNVHAILGTLIMYSIFTGLLMSSLRLISLTRKQQYYVYLSDILVNPQVILGHLGSSFSLHSQPALSLRFAYVALFLSGLLYTTKFSVELNAFLTHPNIQQITSLDDMLRHKSKILAAQNEYKILLMLSGSTFLPYLSLFSIIDSYKEFSEIRGSFNKAYSYPVTSSVWHIYETQQKLFSKPLFRRSNICFVNLDIMGFILPPNSLHKQKFDTLITRVRDMGFVRHWLQNNFYDLVTIGKMNLTDISVSYDNDSYIKSKDFYYVILTMLRAFCISFAVFLVENFWFYRNFILNLLCFKPKIIKNK